MNSEYSLNPCFNGRYSLRTTSVGKKQPTVGLNPCFNGRYSLRKFGSKRPQPNKGLNPCFNGRYSLRNNDNQFSRDYS